MSAKSGFELGFIGMLDTTLLDAFSELPSECAHKWRPCCNFSVCQYKDRQRTTSNPGSMRASAPNLW